MSIKTLFVSLVAITAANAAKAQTFNEMTYSPQATTFSLVTDPQRRRVDVVITSSDSDKARHRTVRRMRADGNGRWRLTVDKDLKGQYYTFVIDGDARHRTTPGIFAKAVGLNGKRGAIIDMADTDPDGWHADRRPALKSPADLVIY